MIEIVEGLYAFVVGAAIGSFLNVCIGRWPEGLSVIRPRSRCPRCGHQIKATENIPIISWLLLRGRCSNCHLPISIQYPIVELLVGLLGVVYPLSARGFADDQGQTELALEASGGWRRRELPFGVFLAPAALIALLFGDAIIAWYMRISGL